MLWLLGLSSQLDMGWELGQIARVKQAGPEACGLGAHLLLCVTKLHLSVTPAFSLCNTYVYVTVCLIDCLTHPGFLTR